MTRAYVLDQSTLAVQGLVDQSWEKLSYTRRYWGMDTFVMTIQRARLWASTIQKGRLLYLPDEGNRIFLIEQVQSVAEGSARNDLMTVAGRSMEGIGMAERLVLPTAGQDYDKQTAVPGETAMKHYVTDHASASAIIASRRVPNLTVIASGGTGANVTVAGRYQTVFDLVKQIGLLTGQGWEILFNRTLGKFEFDIINGVDRHASVFFDFAFDTLEKWEELDSIADSKTVAVVAGQGEGKDRDIRTRWSGSEPAGFARREAFVDARDIDLGATTELDARGDAFIAAAKGETRLEAGIHQYGSFKYGQQWDMGDLVLIRNAERGISYTARVVEVTKSFDVSAAAPTITAIIDRPFPTLKEQVSGAGAGAGAVDYPDTLNPKFDTIILDRLNADVKIARTGVEELTISDGAGGDLSGRLLIKGHTRVERGFATSGAFNAWVTGDTVERIQVLADGTHKFSTGGATHDTLLKRSAAGEITLDANGQANTSVFRVFGTAGNRQAVGIGVTGDTVLRAIMYGDATLQGIEFGPGNATRDTNLYRRAADSLATDDTFHVMSGSGIVTYLTGNTVIRHYNADGDANPNWRVLHSGTNEWGAGGASAVDTNLYRSAANTLKTDDALDVAGIFSALGGIDDHGPVHDNAAFTVANGGTATFSSKASRWVQIGSLVFLRFSFSVTANGSGTSTVTLTGTGFPQSSTTPRLLGDRGGTGVVPLVWRGTNAGAELQPSCAALGAAGYAVVTGADLVNGASYTCVGVYFTADAWS